MNHPTYEKNDEFQEIAMVGNSQERPSLKIKKRNFKAFSTFLAKS